MINGELFITFEGGEGSGKTSQIKRFVDWFAGEHGPVISTREPGGVEDAERIRNVLLDNKNNLSDETELILYCAARREFVKDIVAYNLSCGMSVISDRYYDSTFAYQGYGRGIDLNKIKKFNDEAITFQGKAYHPDLTFLIDVPAIVGLARARDQGELDRIESLDLDFHEKVRQGYLELARQNPERIILVEGCLNKADVFEQVRDGFLSRYL